MSSDVEKSQISQKTLLILAVLLFCFSWLLYESGLLLIWLQDEEYGHGMMVVAVLGYVLYRNRNTLLSSLTPAWLGIFISLLALLMFLAGEVSGIAPIRMYSIWLFALAATISIGGWTLFRRLLIPLGIIFLLIPLPNVLGPILTSQLQLISSKIGVWVIRLFGGVVFLEGNVIDMGSVKLLVAEACAGLRYLFPLMSIGAIAGYLMRAPAWMRWLIFLATIPVTIFMNSFRIGVTGLLSEAYGVSHTEGFLHFFEGWVVFVVSLFILIIFAKILIKFIPESPSLVTTFSFDHISGSADSSSNSPGNNHQSWQTKPAVLVLLGCLVIAVIGTSSFFERDKLNMTNKPFSQFPTKFGEWQANESRLPVSIEVAAGASDYYHSNFRSPSGETVNLYIAYYIDQKQGVAPHSPTLCIPGDGWVIKSDNPLFLRGKDGADINVSRLLITKGDKTIITYYWLKQGDKVFRQQFMARLDLIRFAIIENRADAALIRMVTEVGSSEEIQDADARLQHMAAELQAVISDFVPN